MGGGEDRRRSTNDTLDKTWKLWDHKYRKDANDDIPMSQIGSISECSLKFVETIKQKVRLSEPVAFECFASYKEYILALERIFRKYVRGNSLAGNLKSGTAISLGGVLMNTSSFLLQGPYISWNGFLPILRDFNISLPPSESSTLGKLFPRHIWSETSMNESHEDPLLIMEEVACIFIECSQTVSPSITLHKNVTVYPKVKYELTNTEDPYCKAAKWLEQENWGKR